MDFGCFVELTEFSRKFEGLVPVSMISSQKRGQRQGDQVQRDQSVWVKVTTRSATRMALSMRDVNQSTGDDLLGGGGNEGSANGYANPAGPAANRLGQSLRGLSGITPLRRTSPGTRGGGR